MFILIGLLVGAQHLRFHIWKMYILRNRLLTLSILQDLDLELVAVEQVVLEDTM